MPIDNLLLLAVIIGCFAILQRLIEIWRIGRRIRQLEGHWLELYAEEQNEKEQQEKKGGQKNG